jgi:hypothetical protein
MIKKAFLVMIGLGLLISITTNVINAASIIIIVYVRLFHAYAG